ADTCLYGSKGSKGLAIADQAKLSQAGAVSQALAAQKQLIVGLAPKLMNLIAKKQLNSRFSTYHGSIGMISCFSAANSPHLAESANLIAFLQLISTLLTNKQTNEVNHLNH
ncbi:MAG: hypothetical protein K0Q81_2021, partial [Paenibacillus sp.]|nr:hypothetical protein [Paenibacillus sp.]